MAWAPAPIPPVEPHQGFVSAESKRRFAIQAFVICGLVLVVQVGIPTLFAVVSLPVMMLRDGFRTTHLQGAQWYDGQLWYVAQGRSRSAGGGR